MDAMGVDLLEAVSYVRRMSRVIDLTGNVIGRWTVVRREANKPTGGTMWLCRCECGNEKIVDGIVLRDQRSRSCGCLHDDMVVARSTKHGLTPANAKPPPVYHSWSGMKARVTNPNNMHYASYGGRGITICEKWMTFTGFLEDMGDKPKGTSLDRIDNNGNYCKENCRWSTPKEQSRNKRNNNLVEYNGKTQTVSSWAEELGISDSSMHERLENWSIKRAVSEPAIDPGLRSKNIFLEYNGEKMNLTGWARRLGVTVTSMSRWVKAGRTIEDIVTTPRRKT